MVSAEPDATSQRAVLLALGMCTFMVSLDGRIVAPLLPAIAAEFQTSVATASYTVSGYLLPYGLCQLAYGPLSDRYGKVRVAAYAMVAFSLGTALCGVSNSLGLVLGARVFTGAAAAALIPLTIAYIGDAVPYARRQAALGLLMASSGAAQAFSTSAGGLLATAMSWRSVFPVVGGLSGLATAWLMYRARRAPVAPRSEAKVSYRDALQTALGPLLLLVFVEGALFLGGFPFFSGLLESRFHSAASVIGVVMGVAGVAQVLMARAIPALLRRLSEEQMIFAGSLLMGAAYLTCAAAPSVPWVAAAAGALGAGFGVCHSTLQARATEAFPRGRGRSVALFAFSLFLGGGVGNFAIGLVVQHRGYGASFAAAGAAFVLFAALASRALTLGATRALAVSNREAAWLDPPKP
jgi:predicted MFS family arabinose efflux permease